MAQPDRCEGNNCKGKPLTWRPTKVGYFWLCEDCWSKIQAGLM
jgi:hypothetical protein